MLLLSGSGFLSSAGIHASCMEPAEPAVDEKSVDSSPVVELAASSAVSAASSADDQPAVEVQDTVDDTGTDRDLPSSQDGRLLALNALEDLGVRHPQDVAGLSLPELRSMMGSSSVHRLDR